jgi:hypothetical protein
MAEFALRPLSLGELLDRAFTIFRHRFGAIMIILVACLSVPGLMVLNSLGSIMALAQTTDPSKSPEAQMAVMFALFGKLALIGVVAAVAMLIARTALGWMAHKAMLGEDVEVMDAFSEGFRRFFPMLGLLLIEMAIMFLVQMVLYIPVLLFGIGAAVGGAAPTASFGFGMFAWMIGYFVALLYLFATLFVTTSALIAEEKTNVFRALARSWDLTQGMRWRIVGAMVLIYILVWIVMMGAALAVGVGMGLSQRGPESAGGWMVGILGAGMLFGLLVYGYYYVLQMVTYYDLRVRKEGLDLELASAAMADA